MRIGEINLIAYGKFTNHTLKFPKTAHDFHVIIGPNEAGKSTLRRAIAELLFGIERQSPLGFKHAQSDLRLSTVLQTKSGDFAFIRTKQQKSLRSIKDEALPDTYLAPVLSGLTADVFAQLHCLDHQRLLEGGQGIVDPRNSISQILFQAASGLEGFATIRDAFVTRANELFAPRGRSNEFVKAFDRHASAQKILKDVQVRTKEWVEARDELKKAEDNLNAERLKRRELEIQRSAWERVRRLSSLVARLRKLEQEAGELGDTMIFPPNSKKTLDAAILEIDKAASIVKTRRNDVHDREQQLESIAVDGKTLEKSTEIEGLARLSASYANYPRDLPLRRAEVQQWMSEVIFKSNEFGIRLG